MANCGIDHVTSGLPPFHYALAIIYCTFSIFYCGSLQFLYKAETSSATEVPDTGMGMSQRGLGRGVWEAGMLSAGQSYRSIPGEV